MKPDLPETEIATYIKMLVVQNGYRDIYSFIDNGLEIHLGHNFVARS